MKIKLKSNRGSALLAALCFSTILAIALASYISLCVTTLNISSRNVAEHHSSELVEMGTEEALWALNENNWSNWTFNGSTATKTISGFTFDDGSTGETTIIITNYTSYSHTITVSGTNHTLKYGDIVKTTIANGGPAPLFINAIAGTAGAVAFTNGGNLDSYDSSLGLYANQTPGYSAIVSSTVPSPSLATVQLVNAQIKGYVSSFYAGPSYSTGAKLQGPTTSGTIKIDTTRISTSPFQPVFNIKTLSGAGNTLNNPSGNVTIGIPTDTTPAIYYSTGFDLRGTTKITVDGPVRLVVNGSFYIGLNGGTPSIVITPNGSLEVFTNGDIAIYGNGINNQTFLPSKLAIYGTNTLTVPDMNTTVPYYGVIYTPNGCFSVLGNATIYGSIVAKKVSLTGTPTIHYDLNLRNTMFNGIETPIAIFNWVDGR